AAWSLGQIGGPKAVRALVIALGDDQLRAPARDALRGVGAQATEPLLACLDGTIDDCDPTTAVLIFKDLADPRATPALIAELGRHRVKPELVIEALGAIADPRALVPLLSLVG